MDGWMDGYGWMDMDGWIDAWMDGLVSGSRPGLRDYRT